jgi:hypothetical protein
MKMLLTCPKWKRDSSRNGDLSSRLRVTSDLMTAGALTVELKAESTKAAHDFAVRKSS